MTTETDIEPIPTDHYALVKWLKDHDGVYDGPASGALFDRMEAELGYDLTVRLWDSANADIVHDSAIECAVADLTGALKAAGSELNKALAAVRRLTGGDAWHVEYAETVAGSDIAAFLNDAARMVRAAEALNAKAAS